MNPVESPRTILARDCRPNEDVLDEVYRKYAHSNPFVPVIGFVDHATMAPEALVGLGLGAKVGQWITHHRVRPYAPQSHGINIALAWRDALGRRDYHGDWLKHFETELEQVSFQDVLRGWVPRFAHRVGALLFHGLIRTAHATRALTHRNTQVRRGELARGLALWAIGVTAPSPEAASQTVAAHAPEFDHAHFARMGAATFLAAPNIPNLHLVTGAMAFGLVAPYLDATTHRLAMSSFSGTHARATREFESLKDKARAAPVPSFTEEHLLALAAQSDAHPIKLTEAALRAYDETGDEIFLKAAGKALDIHNLRAVLSAAKTLLSRRANRLVGRKERRGAAVLDGKHA